MKLDTIRRRILRALSDRALDIHDLADTLNLQASTIYGALSGLASADLVWWAYPEDEASITDAGHAALQEVQE